MNVLFNVITFKIGWLSAVFGAANGVPVFGLGIIVAVIAADRDTFSICETTEKEEQPILRLHQAAA